MALETFTAEQFFEQLDALGEDKVRVRVASGAYSTTNKKLQLAIEWLRSKDQSRDLELESERTAIAKRAAEAATRAADAAAEQSRLARTANTRATIALAIAVISAIVSNWSDIIFSFRAA
jgi:uncharacterized protein (DUF3084 family)